MDRYDPEDDLGLFSFGPLISDTSKLEDGVYVCSADGIRSVKELCEDWSEEWRMFPKRDKASQGSRREVHRRKMLRRLEKLLLLWGYEFFTFLMVEDGQVVYSKFMGLHHMWESWGEVRAIMRQSAKAGHRGTD